MARIPREKSLKSRVIGIALSVMLAIGLIVSPAFAESADNETSTVDLLHGCVNALRESYEVPQQESIYTGEKFSAEDSLSQWVAFDFTRLGVEKDGAPFLNEIETYVTESYKDTDKLLDTDMSTEWNRTSLVIYTLGGDPTAFGTDAEGNPIDLIKDGSYGWQQTNSLAIQGANGVAFALIAINTCGVEVPEGERYTIDTMIDELLTLQSSDGGFGLTAYASSVDLTAMSIVALAPYQNEERVALALEQAVDYLSAAQGSDGRYGDEQGGVSSESSSNVIMALCALQINPRTDTRFIKNDVSVFEGLLTFLQENGSFAHTEDSDPSQIDRMATEQATRALIAMTELENAGDGNVYTLDVALELGESSSANDSVPFPWIIGGAAVGVLVVGIVALVASRRRKALQNGRIGRHSVK